MYIYNIGNDSYEASLVEIYPDKKAQPDSHSIEGINFTGIISIWDLKAGFVKSARFKDNHAVEEGIVEFLANSESMTSKAPPIFCAECEDTGTGGGTVNGGQLREVIITSQPSQRSPVVIYIPSGSLNGGGGSTPTGYIPHGGGGGGGGGGITAPTAAQIAAALEKQIDGTKLDPCTKAVLDKLKNLTQNDIAGIFEKFGVPVNGTYTLKIVIGTTSKSVALADTRQVSKNNYLITISEPYLKGTENNQRPPTDLAIATVLIHELIHAHFFALYDDFRNNGNICAYDNYDCLFMEYVSKNFEGTTDPHHSQMFENYIDVMANALQEFQTGIPVSNTGKAALFYHDLALSTMAGTQIFEDRYPLGYNSPTYEERKRITYNREAENDNKTIDDAENGKYIPKGKPCN